MENYGIDMDLKKKKLDSKIILQIGKPLGVYETILQCHKSKKQTYHWGRFDLL